MMSLRERITKRSGVILSKQSLRFESEIASPNRTPSGRSNLFAMTIKFLALAIIMFPCPGFAQLTRVDTMLAAALGGMMPVAGGIPAIMAGDSTLVPLIQAMPKTTFSVTPIFYVSQLSAIVQRADSGAARMDISVQGELLQPMNSLAVPRTLARTVNLDLTANDWNGLQNNTDRYVHYGSPPGGFWSSTLEPIVVVLGAVAVVALFFLIRS
jgi:hypothetical protein